jgi:hypothetical protein
VIDADTLFRFVVSALAAWRLTHLLAAEDGPWDLMLRVRGRLGSTIWGNLMDCFNCLSLWVSIPLAFFVVGGALNQLVAWLAMSGAACLLNRLGNQPIVFESPDH